MTEAPADRSSEPAADVVVVGGGLAGLATATQLARRGRRVVCLEPRAFPRPGVGESLEFSAPALLAELGVRVDTEDHRPHLFPKTSVQIISSADDRFTVWPPAWFARPPIWCSRIAFHADRFELDHQLMWLAVDAGVEIRRERVTTVDHDGDRITAVTTDRGSRLAASWYVDASGHAARLFGRALDLDKIALGQPRMAFWTRVAEPPRGHATNLYFAEPTADDLSWAWEIPLNPAEVSIGVVMSSDRLGALRRLGLRPFEVFRDELATLPRLSRILDRHPDLEVAATAYTPYRHRRSIGPNWVLVGDASAMVDPLTSNGVTSALRHAERAARTVSSALDRGGVRRRHAWAYNHTVPATVATLEQAMETFLYQPTMRQRLGLRWAVNLYAGTGVITNSLYAKINPKTPAAALVCVSMLAASRVWTSTAGWALRQLGQLRTRRRAPGALCGLPDREGELLGARI